MAIVRRVVTVAVCEDDAALRSVLNRSLSGAGHEVLLAHNGNAISGGVDRAPRGVSRAAASPILSG